MNTDRKTALAEPMTAERFSGQDVNGLRFQILGDDAECYAAFGHVEAARFAAAAWTLHLEVVGGAKDDEPIEDGEAIHRWAVLEPAFDGAPDDEWALRWVPAGTEGAFPVTTIDMSAR